ncbi:MAG: hypothetical protein ACP5HZ_12125 [Ferrimicrobium sp.]
MTDSSTQSQSPTVQTQTENVNPAAGYWSPTPPIATGTAPTHAVRVTISRIVPAYYNDLGCAGIPEGSESDPYWYCRASNYSQALGEVIVVRVGAYNNTDYPGLQFGWEKFFKYHKLDLQPVLDGIGIGSEDPNDPGVLRDYHYNSDGDENLQVRIVTSTDDAVGNYSMMSTGPVGVITAYCAGPNYPQDPTKYYYPDCPSWVNTSL